MSSDAIATGRLSAAEYQQNFSDIHPPLSKAQALVEANRCYFCYDAPCIQACPTAIDIPSFIHKISTDNTKGAAHDILSANIMGGICARVCPTEVLCEEVCVRNTGEEKPVTIGALQRYATDWLFEQDIQLFQRKLSTGKKVAVVGAGPAGLACSHQLAMVGHTVTVFEAQPKSGGLNEYGIAAYKVPDQFAQRELEYILAIGGIDIQQEKMLGRDFTIADLRQNYDAVFLGLGLASVNELQLTDEAEFSDSAVDYIADLRQSDDFARLPVGRRVVVIGGGSTAIDIAIQSKRLGAEEVTMVYRRGKEQMSATVKEQEFAQINAVKIIHCAKPVALNSGKSGLQSVTFEYTDTNKDRDRSYSTFELPADVVFKAIGQRFQEQAVVEEDTLRLNNGRIAVDDTMQTSITGVWAGGDCVDKGDDLTVTAVAQGKQAAQAINRYLQS